MAVRAKRAAGLKTSEEILEAARLLFLRQGFHATGMRQIAQESGISLGAVYNHFPSKEEIFQALLAERNLYGTMAEALSRARGDSVAELLHSGFAEIMAALQGRQDFILLLFIDALEFQARHVAVLAGDAVPHIFGFVQRVVVVGRQRGELRDVSPVLLGRAYLGLVFSSFVMENLLKGFAMDTVTRHLSVENWQQGLIDILLHGVLQDCPDGKGE